MPQAEYQQIETSFGKVQVYFWKKNAINKKTPILLLPGRTSGTPMWSENLADFYENRTVFSFDALGDAGLSIQTKEIKDSNDQAQWILETLEKLGLNKIHVIGHSFGGWLAANFAAKYPDKISTLILLEPVFVFQWIKLIILLESIPYNMKFLPKKWREGILKEISGSKTIDTSDPVAKMIDDGANYYKSKLPAPKKISEKQLKSWNFPVFVALAENSGVHNAKKAFNVAKSTIQNGTIKIWKNATHSLPMEFAEPLDKEIIEFIENNEMIIKNDT